MRGARERKATSTPPRTDSARKKGTKRRIPLTDTGMAPAGRNRITDQVAAATAGAGVPTLSGRLGAVAVIVAEAGAEAVVELDAAQASHATQGFARASRVPPGPVTR